MNGFIFSINYIVYIAIPFKNWLPDMREGERIKREERVNRKNRDERVKTWLKEIGW